jgi:hypothetical protein
MSQNPSFISNNAIYTIFLHPMIHRRVFYLSVQAALNAVLIGFIEKGIGLSH